MKEKNVHPKHMSSQIWCDVKLERWRDKKKNFQSKHMSSQIRCDLKFERWRVWWRDEEKNFSPNIHQAGSFPGLWSQVLYRGKWYPTVLSLVLFQGPVSGWGILVLALVLPRGIPQCDHWSCLVHPGQENESLLRSELYGSCGHAWRTFLFIIKRWYVCVQEI